MKKNSLFFVITIVFIISAMVFAYIYPFAKSEPVAVSNTDNSELNTLSEEPEVIEFQTREDLKKYSLLGTTSEKALEKYPGLGLAKEFSIFAEGDLTLTGADTEGRIAAGGGIYAQTDYKYQIGCKNTNNDSADIIVGKGPVENVAINFGYTDDGLTETKDQKIVAYSSTATEMNLDDYSEEEKENFVQTDLIDFESEFNRLRAYSQELLNKNVTGEMLTNKNDYRNRYYILGNLRLDLENISDKLNIIMGSDTDNENIHSVTVFQGTNTECNIFKCTQSQLSSGIAFDVPYNSKVILNITGDNIKLDMGISHNIYYPLSEEKIAEINIDEQRIGYITSGSDSRMGVSNYLRDENDNVKPFIRVAGGMANEGKIKDISEKILINIPEAKNVELFDCGATVLAPNANVVTPSSTDRLKAGYYSGYLLGTLICKSYTGHLQFGSVQNDMIQKYKFNINKLDSKTSQAIPGATFEILDSEGNCLYTWDSTNQPESVELESGEYILRETKAPTGYKQISDMIFTIKSDGIIYNEKGEEIAVAEIKQIEKYEEKTYTDYSEDWEYEPIQNVQYERVDGEATQLDWDSAQINVKDIYQTNDGGNLSVKKLDSSVNEVSISANETVDGKEIKYSKLNSNLPSIYQIKKYNANNKVEWSVFIESAMTINNIVEIDNSFILIGSVSYQGIYIDKSQTAEKLSFTSTGSQPGPPLSVMLNISKKGKVNTATLIEYGTMPFGLEKIIMVDDNTFYCQNTTTKYVVKFTLTQNEVKDFPYTWEDLYIGLPSNVNKISKISFDIDTTNATQYTERDIHLVVAENNSRISVSGSLNGDESTSNWIEFVQNTVVKNGDNIVTTVPIVEELYPYYSGTAEEVKFQPHFYRQNVSSDGTITEWTDVNEVFDIDVKNIKVYWKEVDTQIKTKTKLLQVVEDEDKNDTINILNDRKPIKIKLTKQDMNNSALEGAELEIHYKDKIYKNEGKDYIEEDITGIEKNEEFSLKIYENKSKANYSNVFEGKPIIINFKLNNDYTITQQGDIKILNGNNQVSLGELSKYISVNIDNMQQNSEQITINIVMKNPIKYNLKVIKTDLSGNEISGSNLQFKATKNSDITKNNEGTSTIEFEETDLIPNTVNTYTIEELSTIAPHYNVLENKKLTVEIKINEIGELEVQKFELTDKDTGNTVQNDYVAYDLNTTEADGTRVIRIFLKNPMKYGFKLIKTKATNSNESNQMLEGASLQVNDTVNENGSSEINMEINNVEIGDTKTFYIKEINSSNGYYNLLEGKQIVLETKLNSNKKLEFITENLLDEATQKTEKITDEIKEKYRFNYSIVTDENGYEQINVTIQNPIKFNVKVIKLDAQSKELSGALLEIKNQSGIVKDNSTDRNSVLEFLQENAEINGVYSFTINEKESISPNKNILDGKDLNVDVKVNEDGTIEIVSSNIKNVSTNTTETINSQLINMNVENIDGIQTLVVKIINPVEYDIDLVKKSTNNNFINNTDFKVYAEGIDTAIFDGCVTDIETQNTTEIAEKDKLAGRYTYYITETKTANNSYINILDQKYIKINAEVSGTGQVTIMNSNWEKDEQYFEIYEGDINNRQSTDSLVDKNNSIYQYISTNIVKDSVTGKNTIKINVINPIKYVVQLEKHIYGEEKLCLNGAKFNIESDVLKLQQNNTNINEFIGVEQISETGIVSGTTTQNGTIKYEEKMVNDGIYEYWISEIETGDQNIINALQDKYIKIRLKVNSDGSIVTLTENDEEKDGTFYIYDSTKENKIDFEQVSIDELINVYVTTENGLNTIHIKINNTQKYDLKLIKTDKDTNQNMNNIIFNIKTYYNTIGEEIKLKNALNINNEHTTQDLKTSNIESIDGVIKLENILFEKAGTYYFEFIETTPLEPIIYKNKSENVIIKVDVLVEDGKYKINNMEVVQGEQYTLDATTNNTENSINVNILNERVKGSYNITITKLGDLIAKPVIGAEFEIETYIEKEDSEEKIILYKSTDSVTSQEQVIPAKFTITDETGLYAIENIRIENLEPYMIKITETKAPEGCSPLKEPIIIKCIPEITGENDDAKFVIKNFEIISGTNNEFVTISNTQEQLDVTVKNKQLCDLSLRKFITKINNKEITTRIPVFKIDTDGNYQYEHDKTPLEVAHENIVEYTIRVYNEGNVNAYASVVKDDIPEGLVLVKPQYDSSEKPLNTNAQYRWKMLTEDGKETQDETKAKYIVTDYLSKEVGEEKIDNNENPNLLKLFDTETMETPDFRDIKVEFKVNKPSKSEDIIINSAQISNDKDEFGKDVEDIDSTTDEWIDNEDDQDKEYIKLTYFDLSLKKWVSQAIISENGKQEVVNTGHTGNEKVEPVVKVDIAKKELNNINVKFKYEIKVTNEGIIPGVVKEISDYIPQGLKFEKQNNPNWEEVDGKVVTKQLENTVLQPGESKTVSIILTWINSEDNLGLKENIAEISKDFNEYGDSIDVDSTPNNRVSGEDDIDTASVMLQVKTGQKHIYIGIAIATLVILALGTFGIKKFILK